MTVDPPLERLLSRDAAHAAPEDELAVIGGEITADSLELAYRSGFFLWPCVGEETVELVLNRARPLIKTGRVTVIAGGEPPTGIAGWWSPDPRAVLTSEAVHVSRNVRRCLRRSSWTTTHNRAFADVVDACRARRGPLSWLCPSYLESAFELHERGIASSTEVWEGNRLVGGCFLFRFGGVAHGQSAFFERERAADVAILDWTLRAFASGLRIVDCGFLHEGVRQLGAFELPRAAFLAALHEAHRDNSPAPPSDAWPATWILSPGAHAPTISKATSLSKLA